MLEFILLLNSITNKKAKFSWNLHEFHRKGIKDYILKSPDYANPTHDKRNRADSVGVNEDAQNFLLVKYLSILTVLPSIDLH